MPLHRAGLAALPRGSARPQPTHAELATPVTARTARPAGLRQRFTCRSSPKTAATVCSEPARRRQPVRMSDGTRGDTGPAPRRCQDHEAPRKGRDSRLSPLRRRLVSLALPPHYSSPPFSPGPIASSSLGRRRTRSGPAAGPPQGTIPVHKRARRLYRERPQSIAPSSSSPSAQRTRRGHAGEPVRVPLPPLWPRP